MVVPRNEGLTLDTLPPRPPRRQILPGSRDLLAFCPRSGRALLRRHWPDYRRSLEWLEPGQPPQELWRGSEALLAATCQGGGERIWAALLSGERQPELSLLALDHQRKPLLQQRFAGWELEPGTQLHHDPTTERLVAALRPRPPPGQEGRRPPPARAMVLSAVGGEGLALEPRFLEPPHPVDAAAKEVSRPTSAAVEPSGPPVRQVLWLPAGAVASQ